MFEFVEVIYKILLDTVHMCVCVLFVCLSVCLSVCMYVCMYVCTRVFICIQALMSLFVLASKDGWVNIMYTGLDAVGINQQVFVALYSLC